MDAFIPGNLTAFHIRDVEDYDDARTVITSVRGEAHGPHWYLTVYNRGANAGRLVVAKEDIQSIVARLIPPERWLMET